jgi:acyl-coenzyme A synthetase/AMP-(fatty) acid ligase
LKTEDSIAGVSSQQLAIKARCIHPSRAFVPFSASETEGSIVERFQRQVDQFPDQLALKSRTQACTYSELNHSANRVAHALLNLPGKDFEAVGLLLEHGGLFVQASLGVLKAGRIQIPLETSFPRSRLSYMLEQSQATVLITDDANLSLAQEFADLSVINIDAIDDSYSSANPGLVLASDRCVEVGYTSGSTGLPKGIARNQRGILHNVMRVTNSFRIGVHDRMIMSRPNLVGHLYALLNGASTYPVSLGQEEPHALADWLIQEKVTIFRAAVSAFRGFATGLSAKEEFRDLRLIALFGEPVYQTEVALYRKCFSDGCLLAGSLGCSEFGDYAYFFLDKETPLATGTLPGGYPVAGAEIRLLDDNGDLLGVDQIGEIAVRSRFTAVGYWRRPDLTQASFLPDPADREGCIYRTGDLGSQDAEGCLFHHGRKDFQIKIRGYRVEIAEVEAAILEWDWIKEAAVVGRQDALNDNRLVAYVVPVAEPVPNVSELRRLLTKRLPDYMVPSSFVMLDALPLTATGKVDRRSLPAPKTDRPELETAYVSHRNLVEENLARIWAEVLGVDRVGIHDTFLELGGNSLLATMVVSRVLAQFQVQLKLRLLMDAPTVAEMAELIVRTLIEEPERLPS